MGFQNATEIQQKCIPHVLAGRNLVGRAKTVLFRDSNSVCYAMNVVIPPDVEYEIGVISLEWICVSNREAAKQPPLRYPCCKNCPKILMEYSDLCLLQRGRNYIIICSISLPWMFSCCSSELALQIAEQFRAFGQPLNLKDAVVIGGTGTKQKLTA